MLRQLQYYISDSLNPYENLAIEKHLLDTTPEDCCTLYLWQNQNTVVIGQNQNPWAECRIELLQAEGGRLARRLSGGGAVYHDTGNVNFTFLCASENADIQKQMQVIERACALAGIQTELSGRNDILADGRKFSGNAFYNAAGKSYHHGTLLLCADTERMQRYLTPPKAKLAAKGVKSVKSRVVNLTELAPDLTCAAMKAHMLAAFEDIYGITAKVRTVSDKDAVCALAQQYGSWDYLFGSTIPFSAETEAHFPWGNLQLLLDVRGGVIADMQVYTDAMDFTLAGNIQSALTGCRYAKAAMQSALSATLPQDIANDLNQMLENHTF